MATHYGTAVAERPPPGNMHCNYGDIKFNSNGKAEHFNRVSNFAFKNGLHQITRYTY